MNIIPQDQTDDEPLRFTTPIPPLRNQAYYQHLALVLVKPIIVHSIF